MCIATLQASMHTDAAMKNNHHGKSKLHTNLIKITSLFSVTDLKMVSLLFFSTGSESRKETVIFVALSAMPHLCMPHFMSEVRQLNIAFADLGTRSYLTLTGAGQLLCQPQENNKQGVPSLWTPPNKTARQTLLKTRQPYVHDRPYQDHLRWTNQTLTSTLLISETSNPLNTSCQKQNVYFKATISDMTSVLWVCQSDVFI